jgi:hypothetical protein
MNDIPPPVRLDDDDWKRLAKMVSLPETAREQLERLLGLGRFFVERVSSTPASHAMKKRLSAISEKADSLAADLRGCAGDMDVSAALVEPQVQWASAPAPRLAAHRSLEKHIETVDSLAKWFRAARDRLPDSKKGNKTAEIHKFVADIDWLLRERTGKGLTRGNNPGEGFLRECLDILGFNITTEAAIRKLTSKRNGKVSAENS